MGFVAVNYISCSEEYRERFEQLFSTRARAIDQLPGFQHMYVLKPIEEGNDYLVISHWNSQADFKSWTRSPEFLEGHKRGFEDIARAKAEGRETPMTSTFRTYSILTS
jgi:heme oxygenase (mycobilin-producing)